MELERRITEFPDLGLDEPDHEGNPEGKVKIAQITFAYENSQIIRWLSERGTYIKQEKWEKVDGIN